MISLRIKADKKTNASSFIFFLILTSLLVCTGIVVQSISQGLSNKEWYYHSKTKPANPSSAAVESPQERHRVTMTQNTNDNNGEKVYLQAAHDFDPVTDKVTGHTYQIMYGQYLLPYYQAHPTMKILEIGLGCNMDYGPGASAKLHKKLFPLAELWEAERDGQCVEASLQNGKLQGFHTLVGDQGDPATLNRWILESGGGNFDVIIDDGGHDNCQIWTSFVKLWPTLKRGGLYFIEDMQVAKKAAYQRTFSELCPRATIVPDKIKEMIDTLMYDTERKGDIKFVFCQSEACVIGKKE